MELTTLQKTIGIVVVIIGIAATVYMAMEDMKQSKASQSEASTIQAAPPAMVAPETK